MTAQPKSTMQAAFEAAGYRDANAILAEIADRALRQGFVERDQMREFVYREVGNDARLLWAMFDRWRGPAADMLLDAARARRAEEQRAITRLNPSISPPSRGASMRTSTTVAPPQAAGSPHHLRVVGYTDEEAQAARNSAARVLWKIDTFPINGRPIGDCTVDEALGARDVRLRDARFIELVTAGVPSIGRIRDYVTREDAEKAWEQAHG